MCHKPRCLTKSRIVTVCDAFDTGADPPREPPAPPRSSAFAADSRSGRAAVIGRILRRMSRIQFYILRQVAVATLFIAVTLTAVVWLTQSTRFFKLILNRGLSLDVFLELTSLLVPSFLLITLPIALFLATLFVLNKMLNDRELLVMRTAGLSDLYLSMPVITLGIVSILVCFFISLYLLPVSFKNFRNLHDDVRSNFSVGLIQKGVFNNFGSKITIYVRDRAGDEVRGILVQDNRDSAKAITMVAERGRITITPAGPHVLMSRGSRQERDRKTGKISTLYFQRYSFDFTLEKRRKRVDAKPNERFLGTLLWPGSSTYDRRNRSKLVAQGHNRLIAPLYALTLPILALVVMLAGQFNKRGQGIRIALALSAAGICEGIAIGLTNASADMNALIPLAYANTIFPIVFGLILLVRTKWLNALAGLFERTSKHEIRTSGPVGP